MCICIDKEGDYLDILHFKQWSGLLPIPDLYLFQSVLRSHLGKLLLPVRFILFATVRARRMTSVLSKFSNIDLQGLRKVELLHI